MGPRGARARGRAASSARRRSLLSFGGMTRAPLAVRLALACLAIEAPACDAPAVAARAVWTDREHVGGARTIHIYSRGALTTTRVTAADQGRDPEGQVLRLALAPGGDGALVMAGDPSSLAAAGASVARAGYLDFAGRRALPLALPLGGGAAPAPGFAAAGDALWWIDPCASRLEVVPVGRSAEAQALASGGRAVVPLRMSLGTGDEVEPCPLRWGVSSAASGAIAFVIAGQEPFALPASAPGGDGAVTGPRPGPIAALEPVAAGEVIALRYPGRGAAVEGLVELGRGRLLDGVAPARLGGCAGELGCLGLVDPEGAAVSVVSAAGEACRIQRWSWIGGAERASCVWTGEGEVIAAISSRHYVVRQEAVVARVDWVTGEAVALPLLGVKERWQAQVLPGGRAVAMVSTGGPMLRLGVDRVELVSIEQTTCAIGQRPVVSPSGLWAAWACSGALDGLDVDGGAPLSAVIRVSVDGLERYDGVPMWALAIDDGGDLLLFSRGDSGLSGDLTQPSSSPRNLYVLRSDGELSRVDTLEPDPALSLGLGGELRWIDAAPLPLGY